MVALLRDKYPLCYNRRMIYPLEHAHFAKIAALLGEVDIHLAARSILAGRTPAEVYVDDPQRPQAVLARTQHRLLIAGNPELNGFNLDVQRLFAEKICPEAQAAGQEGFILYYARPGWEACMEMLLEGQRLHKVQREYFVLNPNHGDRRAYMPQGFTLRSVDAALLADAHLQGLEALREEMCSERTSVEDFLNFSFGICALQGDRLAGWCLSEYNTGDRCEVGIATMEPYQQKGLATAMMGALEEMAFAGGMRQIGWHCYAANFPSSATARKAGFSKVCEYPATICLL
jgi:GNAT superfamily N-acetyltransferase